MSWFHRATRRDEIDVLVVSDGVLPLPAAILATNADSAVLAGRHVPAAGLERPLNVVVVRSGS